MISAVTISLIGEVVSGAVDPKLDQRDQAVHDHRLKPDPATAQHQADTGQRGQQEDH